MEETYQSIIYPATPTPLPIEPTPPNNID
jgi:hypothetical protein